jgi:hypothetical protein
LRPRGLEPPRTIQSARPSTTFTSCGCSEQRPDRANRGGCWTYWTQWKGWMLSRRLRTAPALVAQNGRTAVSSPLAEEGSSTMAGPRRPSIDRYAPNSVPTARIEAMWACCPRRLVLVCAPTIGWGIRPRWVPCFRCPASTGARGVRADSRARRGPLPKSRAPVDQDVRIARACAKTGATAASVGEVKGRGCG